MKSSNSGALFHRPCILQNLCFLLSYCFNRYCRDKQKCQVHYIYTYPYIHKVLLVSGVTVWSWGSGKATKWEEEGYGEYGECVSSSGQVSFPAPSLQLSSNSDESLALLYLSHSDEVELMATFTPADVISVVRLGSRRVGEAGTPAGNFCCPPANILKVKKIINK